MFRADSGALCKVNVTYLSVTFVLPTLQARLGGFTGSPHKNTLAAQFRTAPRTTVSPVSLPPPTPRKAKRQEHRRDR